MKHLKYSGEAERRSVAMREQAQNKKGFAQGGRVHAYPKMRFGADSGPGRLEKIAKYGKNARPTKGQGLG